MTHPLYSLLSTLEAAHIHFTVGRYRPDTILVALTLVGERVEVDVFEDGHMEVSRFIGDENIIGDADLIAALIDQNRE
jgi:hypothetical protein